MNHPAAFSVRRWQFTLVIFFGLIAIGFQSLRAIPKAEDPSLPLATFLVVAVLPGAAPSDVERLVVDPIESRLGQLEDVKRQRSDISDGLAVIQVEFREGVDANRKHDDVLREVSSLRPTLPSELDSAIQKAGEARFVSVLFTTLTALGGLLPLVYEHSALYSPLAVVLVGGLISSTLLARIVTPVLYRLLPPPIETEPQRQPVINPVSRALLA